MRIGAVAALFVTLGLAACGNNETGFAPSALSGPFTLQTVNTATLPAVVVDSANPPLRLDALSGVITIMADNVFTSVTTFRQTLGGVVTTRTVSCTGRYTAVGTVFEFTNASPAAGCSDFSGVVSGTTLTASVLGVPAVFRQ